MNAPATPTTMNPARVQLSPAEALAAAKRSWASSLVICGIGLIMIIGILLTRQPAAGDGLALPPGSRAVADQGVAGLGLGGLMVGLAVVWLVILGPVVLVLRSYCFRAAWDGRAVEPGSYLKGMSSIWGVLTVGAMLALVASALREPTVL